MWWPATRRAHQHTEDVGDPVPLGTALLALDLTVAAPGGRVVLFGNVAGGTQAPLPPAGRLIGGAV